MIKIKSRLVVATIASSLLLTASPLLGLAAQPDLATSSGANYQAPHSLTTKAAIDWQKNSVAYSYSADQQTIESVTFRAYSTDPRFQLTINNVTLPDRAVNQNANGTYTIRIRDFNSGSPAQQTDAIKINGASSFPGSYTTYIDKPATPPNVLIPGISSLEYWSVTHDSLPLIKSSYNLTNQTYQIVAESPFYIYPFDYSIAVVNRSTGQVVATKSGQTAEEVTLSFTADGTHDYTVVADYTDHLWQQTTHAEALVYSIGSM